MNLFMNWIISIFMNLCTRDVLSNGYGIELEAVGLQFEPYQWLPCGVTWDSSWTVVVIKLLQTSALPEFMEEFMVVCKKHSESSSNEPKHLWALPVTIQSRFQLRWESSSTAASSSRPMSWIWPMSWINLETNNFKSSINHAFNKSLNCCRRYMLGQLLW